MREQKHTKRHKPWQNNKTRTKEGEKEGEQKRKLHETPNNETMSTRGKTRGVKRRAAVTSSSGQTGQKKTERKCVVSAEFGTGLLVPQPDT